MGYGKTFHDMKLNIHISGKRGPEGFRETFGKLSPEARNCITVENEENSWGLDACLTLADIVPTVLDIHHYWIREGAYIQPTDDRIKRVVDSWQGVRPTMHYSCSREDYLVNHDTTVMPNYQELLATGHKKQKLRAHSDFMWNNTNNEWAVQFLEHFDIMVEAKGKNLASQQVYDCAVKMGML
jgi:UV DNA damage repair endonuclease